MSVDYGWLSLLPPLLAIALALLTRQVHLSLFAGIWVGGALLASYNPIAGAAGAMNQIIDVITSRSNAETLLFTLVVGALIVLMRESGGVAGFAEWMVARGWVRGPKSAQLISALLGISIFIESNITCLVTGTVSRPLYDRVGLSRAKLAYVCDSTSAPICMLIPLNAWGAMILSLLAAEGLAEPLSTLLAAIPLNFYAILALAMVFWVTFTGLEIGPMREAERAAREAHAAAQSSAAGAAVGSAEAEDPAPGAAVEPDGRSAAGTMLPAPAAGGLAGKPGVVARARNLLVPVVVTVGVVPLVLWVTGDGDWTQGSGSTAVLWATSTGVVVAMAMYAIQRIFSFVEMAEHAITGFQELVPVAAILALALAMGDVCRALDTGPWVASTVSPYIGPATAAPLIFLTGCVIAFSTGSSWGTFAILMPIAVPLALAADASVPLAVGAVMGGGIFGDHCSPISDTTVVSSMSAGCDHIEHVATQIPYAIIPGTLATVLYLMAGWVL